MINRNIKVKTKIIIVLCILSVVTLFNSCKDSSIFNEPYIVNQTEFKIESGACGSIIFSEKIGNNYLSAYKELEDRKLYEFNKNCPNVPCNEIQFESYKIEVVDKNNKTPNEEFYAIRVIDKQTKLLLHSVSEVITTNGNFFRICWCPD